MFVAVHDHGIPLALGDLDGNGLILEPARLHRVLAFRL